MNKKIVKIVIAIVVVLAVVCGVVLALNYGISSNMGKLEIEANTEYKENEAYREAEEFETYNEVCKSAEEFELRFYDKQPENEEKTHIILDKSETEKYDYNIYVYDGSVNILINGEEMSLRNALLQNKITMDEIIEKANKDFPDAISYDDGGSMEYHYENYTIIKVHTIDGNRDVYIGNKDMTIHDLNV
jgi:hypothetical protein